MGNVRVLGPGRAPGWRHRFNKRGRDGTGKGNIEPADAHVWGVVYGLTAAQLDLLDGFEGGYRRCALVVEAGREALATIAYVGLQPGSCLRPAPWYLEHYRVGIRQHGLPEAWLAEVERHATLG